MNIFASTWKGDQTKTKLFVVYVRIALSDKQHEKWNCKRNGKDVCDDTFTLNIYTVIREMEAYKVVVVRKVCRLT
jgi:hypothetical protein